MNKRRGEVEYPEDYQGRLVPVPDGHGGFRILTEREYINEKGIPTPHGQPLKDIPTSLNISENSVIIDPLKLDRKIRIGTFKLLKVELPVLINLKIQLDTLSANWNTDPIIEPEELLVVLKAGKDKGLQYYSVRLGWTSPTKPDDSRIKMMRSMLWKVAFKNHPHKVLADRAVIPALNIIIETPDRIIEISSKNGQPIGIPVVLTGRGKNQSAILLSVEGNNKQRYPVCLDLKQIAHWLNQQGVWQTHHIKSAFSGIMLKSQLAIRACERVTSSSLKFTIVA